MEEEPLNGSNDSLEKDLLLIGHSFKDKDMSARQPNRTDRSVRNES